MAQFLKNAKVLKWMILLSFLVFFINQVIMLVLLKNVNLLTMMELQVTTSKASFIALIQSLGKENMEGYYYHFFADFVYIIAYVVLFFSIVKRFFLQAKVEKRGRIFLILPFLAGIMDVIENCFHLYFMSQNYEVAPWLYTLSGVASIHKWAFIWIEMWVIAILFFKLTILHKR